jgi:hypothetical protein
MQRSRTSLVSLAAGLLLLTTVGCGKKSVDPVQLIPEGAIAIGGVDMAPLMAAPLFAENKDALLEQADAKDFLVALKACKLDPTKDAKLLIAIADEDRAMVTINSKGIGVEANLKCMLEKSPPKNGEAKLGETSGKKSLILGDGEGVCFLASADVLACASNNWTTDVVAILDGKGKPAVAGSLKAPLASADKSKPLWVSAQMTGALAEETKGGPLEKATSVSGSLEFTNGMAVAISLGLATPEDASALAKTLNDQLAQVLPLAPMVGVPKPVADSVKVAAVGSTIEASAAATVEELKAISETVKGMTQ